MRHPFLAKLSVSTLLATIFICGASAQTINTVYSFGAGDSGEPEAIPVQGRNGLLYGTTFGVDSSSGRVFSFSPNGQGRGLAQFNGANGAKPVGGVTLGSDGNFYGVTFIGGSANQGVLFRVSPSGSYTVLHEFAGGSDGANPAGPPIQAADGNFYGTTRTSDGNSTVYKYNSTAGLVTIYQFDQIHGAFASPSLVEGNDGKLYGVAQAGGRNNCGTIFKMTTSGELIWFDSFTCGADGGLPQTSLVQVSNGLLYGTTSQFGANNAGTAFQVDTSGNTSTIYQFLGSENGEFPVGLMQATDGNLYGTANGGVPNGGVLFRLKLDGTYTVIQSFSKPDGVFPFSGPVQDTNGLLYGTTFRGGVHSYGTLYSVDLGLSPFICFVRSIGKVGRTVQLLGQSLTGSSAVSFNGVPATSFNVVSDTFMTAVVPPGATTGPVVVTTPTGTLTSNRNFVVR